jgi:hypothetical protein
MLNALKKQIGQGPVDEDAAKALKQQQAQDVMKTLNVDLNREKRVEDNIAKFRKVCMEIVVPFIKEQGNAEDFAN